MAREVEVRVMSAKLEMASGDSLIFAHNSRNLPTKYGLVRLLSEENRYYMGHDRLSD